MFFRSEKNQENSQQFLKYVNSLINKASDSELVMRILLYIIFL